MPTFNRLAVVSGLALFTLTAHAQARNELPCQAYSRSSAVFVGVAAAPVKRWVQLPNHPPLEMKLTPVTVDGRFSVIRALTERSSPLDFHPAITSCCLSCLRDVVYDPTSRIDALVRDGGCAPTAIDELFNGRVRGVLRGLATR